MMKQLVACALIVKMAVLFVFFFLSQMVLSLQIEHTIAFFVVAIGTSFFALCYFISSLMYFSHTRVVIVSTFVGMIAMGCFVFVALFHHIALEVATLLGGAALLYVAALYLAEKETPRLTKWPVITCLSGEATIIFAAVTLLSQKLFGISILR